MKESYTTSFRTQEHSSDQLKLKVVPLIVVTSPSHKSNYIDIVSDLEPNAFTTMFQAYMPRPGYSKKAAKSGDKLQYNIDFEKKREMVGQYYKALFARNGDVERSIDHYKQATHQRGKLPYNPLEIINKGELYLDFVSISSLIQQFSPFIEDSFKQKNLLWQSPGKTRTRSVNPHRPKAQSKFISITETHEYDTRSKKKKNRKSHLSTSAFNNSESALEINSGNLMRTSQQGSMPTEQMVCISQNFPYQANGTKGVGGNPFNDKQLLKKRMSATVSGGKMFRVKSSVAERLSAEAKQEMDIKTIKLDGCTLNQTSKRSETDAKIAERDSPLKSRKQSIKSIFEQRSLSVGVESRRKHAKPGYLEAMIQAREHHNTPHKEDCSNSRIFVDYSKTVENGDEPNTLNSSTYTNHYDSKKNNILSVHLQYRTLIRSKLVTSNQRVRPATPLRIRSSKPTPSPIRYNDERLECIKAASYISKNPSTEPKRRARTPLPGNRK